MNAWRACAGFKVQRSQGAAAPCCSRPARRRAAARIQRRHGAGRSSCATAATARPADKLTPHRPPHVHPDPARPQLRPYQRRSLSHMLTEERAPGGSSRHLWVKFGLPQHPGESRYGRRPLLARRPTRLCCACRAAVLLQLPVCVGVVRQQAAGAAGQTSRRPACHSPALASVARTRPPGLPAPPHADLHCYVSPILHQVRCSTSRIEAEQWVHANGGAGWIALQARAAGAGAGAGAGAAAVRRLVLEECRVWATRCGAAPTCERTRQRFSRGASPSSPFAAPPDGHGQDGVRGGRDPDEPAARGLARQPQVAVAALPRSPV